MQFLLDHALAVVAGSVLLIAALTLQTQSRLHAVQETVSDAARARAVSLGEMLAEEFDNVLSEPQATEFFGAHLCRLRRDPSDSVTERVEVPAYVRTAAASLPTPGHVRYRLLADGDSVQTSDTWLPTYDLVREVDQGTGYSAPDTVGTGIVDFDVVFGGRATETTSGTPPIRFRQIGFEIAVAMPDLAGERRFHNVARVSHVIRPPNLTVGT